MSHRKLSEGQRRVVIAGLGFLLVVIASVLFLINSLPDYVDTPTARRLSVLTDREIEMDLEPLHFPPYQFLIGVKGRTPECPPFEGTISISGPDGKQTKILIDSASSQKSTWLDEHSETGYILTWGKHPSLTEILVRGHPYRVRVRFEEPLPDGSSLWFSSMLHNPTRGEEEAQQGGSYDGG
jgi:hypothetical protein